MKQITTTFLFLLSLTTYSFAQVNLFELITAGDAETLKTEIADEPSRLNEVDPHHNNLLHALAAGDEIAFPQLIALADWLVRAGADLRARNLDGLTPEEAAREHLNFNIAEILRVEEQAVDADTPSSSSSGSSSGGFSGDTPDNSQRPGFHGTSHATDLIVVQAAAQTLESLASLSDGASAEELRQILLSAYKLESIFKTKEDFMGVAICPLKKSGETPVVLRLRRLGLLNFGPPSIVATIISGRRITTDDSGDYLFFRIRDPEARVQPQLLPGKLGLMFSNSRDLQIILASLGRAFMEAYDSRERLSRLLANEEIDLLERLKSVGVDLIPPKDAPNRIKKLQNAKATATEIIRILTRKWAEKSRVSKMAALYISGLQPDLLNAYLLYEWLENQLEYANAEKNAQDSDLNEVRIWYAFFSAMGPMAAARQMLRPFANLFQDLMSEPQLEALEFERELLGEYETEEAGPRKTKKRHRRRPKGKEKENASAEPSVRTAEDVEEAHDEVENTENVLTIAAHTRAAPSRKSPEQRAAERRERARQIVEAHKQLSSSSSSSSSTSSFRQLRNALSAQEAQLIIDSLNSRQREVFDVLFNPRHDQSDRIISHHDVLALARAIQDQVILIRQEWDDSFYKLVKRHVHPAHDSSDTGDLLPRHYLDVLRTFFIMFGAAPKDWR